MNDAAKESSLPSLSEWQVCLRQLEHAARWAAVASRRLHQLSPASREHVPISLGALRSTRSYGVVQRPATAVPDQAYWPRSTRLAAPLRPAPGFKAASLRTTDHRVILYDLRGLAARSLEAAVTEVERGQIERMDFVPVFVTDCLEFDPFLGRGYVFEYLPASPNVSASLFDSGDWTIGRLEWLSAKWGALAVVTWGAKQRRTGAEAAVFVYPDYRSSNPYQQLMYPQGRSFAVHYADIAKAAIHAANGGTTIFHLHWEDATYRTLAPARQSKARERFVSEVRQFKELGGVFIWTMHNLVPHDGVDPKKAIVFNKEVAALADVIHVHSHSAADQACRKFDIDPGRLRIIEHPSYEGAYPSAEPSDGLRERYGLGDDEFVLLCFGTIRPYKNLDALLEAVETLSPQVRVVIAGAPGRHPVAAQRDRVIVIDRLISAQEVSELFGLADFAVVPMDGATTSGTVMLSLTMGTPLIVPAGGIFSELISDGREGLLFRPEVVGDLRSVVLKASGFPAWQRRAMRAAALATAAFHNPEKFAEEVGRMIHEAIDLRTEKEGRVARSERSIMA